MIEFIKTWFNKKKKKKADSKNVHIVREYEAIMIPSRASFEDAISKDEESIHFGGGRFGGGGAGSSWSREVDDDIDRIKSTLFDSGSSFDSSDSSSSSDWGSDSGSSDGGGFD